MALIVLASVVAVAAALRSTWSPCGLSMLSTITPLTERARGHRWGVTVTWFVLGAVVGGTTLGLLTAGLALGAAALFTPTGALAAAALVAATCALVDEGALGRRPPFLKRQVDDAWLRTYRPWVYGVGFGWQIGAGVTTYIMTAAVFATIALAALTGSPATALAICTLFGLSRGLVVLLGARLDSPAAMARFHQRFDALEAPVRHGVAAVQAVVAVVAAGLAAGPLAAGGLAAVVAVAVALARRVPRRVGADARA